MGLSFGGGRSSPGDSYVTVTACRVPVAVPNGIPSIRYPADCGFASLIVDHDGCVVISTIMSLARMPDDEIRQDRDRDFDRAGENVAANARRRGRIDRGADQGVRPEGNSAYSIGWITSGISQ
jgi:hypothetical protein